MHQPMGRSSHQQKYRYQILRICFSHDTETLHAMLPEDPRCSTLHKRYLRQLEEISSGSSLESVTHVLQPGFQHPPSHAIAEKDHACREAFARLRKRLDEAARNLEATGYNMNRNFVAKITQLECGVETAISPSHLDFLGVALR